METINLHGVWRYETDENDIGIAQKFYERTLKNDGYIVPGSACDNKIGKKAVPFTEMTTVTTRSLIPAYEYEGALWLQREFECDNLAGKFVTLYLERVNIASQIWIDGNECGRQIIELSAPHIYKLPELAKGVHTLTIRIDNRNLLNIDKLASGYSFDTQSIWLGIIGKAEIRIEEIFNISDIRIFPSETSARVDVTLNCDCHSPEDRREAKLKLEITAPDGTKSGPVEYSTTLFDRRSILHIDCPMGDNIEYWDEFNPVLYTIDVTYECGGAVDTKSEKFGMRRVWADGKQLMINDSPLYLRGTTDCAIFPLTGYPPTDLESWLHIMRTLKEYGLNFIRFHSWCPPDIAFYAADTEGIYVLAEMPVWLNLDVCTNDVGGDMIHRDYYTKEALVISRTYGNHPSFIMFSNGNELMGDFELLEDITTQIKALDNRRLYTMTSNFDHRAAPCEDFLLAFEIYGNRVRLQHYQDEIAENTSFDYNKAVEESPLPLISFEVGQYCVYPDVDSVKDYTGNLLPLNFDVIKKDMQEKGIYHNIRRYVYASGRFSALMYKQEIESAMHTDKMGGISLLSLTDYTGQNTATIGPLDAFYKSKGIIDGEEFRRFSNHTVPLMKAGRIFKNTDTFNAEFMLYNHGKAPVKNPIFEFKLINGDEVVYEIKTADTSISVPLGFIKDAAMLKAVLRVNEYENDWNIFVYPDETENISLPILTTKAEVMDMVKSSGCAIVKMTGENLKTFANGEFKSIFWSPAYFKSTRTSGLILDKEHPVFKYFPTLDTADFQWKKPIEGSISADIGVLPKDFKLMVEPVPNFFENIPRSPMFEARVGKAKLLFCGFNLTSDDTESAALKNAIAKYTASEEFDPQQELTADILDKLLK